MVALWIYYKWDMETSKHRVKYSYEIARIGWGCFGNAIHVATINDDKTVFKFSCIQNEYLWLWQFGILVNFGLNAHRIVVLLAHGTLEIWKS